MTDPRGIISPPPVGGVRIEGASPLRRVEKRRRGEEDDRQGKKRQPQNQRPLPPDDGLPHVDVLA